MTDLVSSGERSRKKIILLCGVVLFFFTSMSKVAVPGAVFNALHDELHFGAGLIAMLGSAFMYAYAASQFAIGLYSDRYGGVRVLLFGGSLFSAGSLLFPLCSRPLVLLVLRLLIGLGAGTVFLGVSKLVADLFEKRFSTVLGVVLFISYLGPVTGGLPTVWVVDKLGWRTALLIPALICMAAMAVIWSMFRGTLQPVCPTKNSVLLHTIFGRKENWMLFWPSSMVFGVYYTILSITGQKSLEDCGHWSRLQAGVLISVLALIVAANNIFFNVVLKLFGGRRKAVLLFCCGCSLAGTLAGAAAFHYHAGGSWLALSYILMAIPAGFFPFFSLIAKELNPPQYTGCVIAMLNFMAFVAIAGSGNLAGCLLGAGEGASGGAGYPPEAYRNCLLVFALLMLSGVVTACFCPETAQKIGGRKSPGSMGTSSR